MQEKTCMKEKRGEVVQSSETVVLPPITHHAPQYGRGIHALPNTQERELFDRSSEAFIEGDILGGYAFFLSSLIHQPNGSSLEHLRIERSENALRFQLVQGCALIRGEVTSDFLTASADIALSDTLHVALKRHFLERDFQLTYCRFSQKEGVISLSIRLDNATITPQKIFFPLREISLNADFEKEFIAGEFDESVLLETSHLLPLPLERIERNYAFMQRWIQETLQSLVGLLSNDNTGMTSFSYLTLLLQIDYLLLPRKKMAKNISEKINGYFLDDEKLTEDKNADLEEYLGELRQMDLESFATQFYDSVYTFSPYEQAMHDEIVSFIDESLTKVRWYKNNRSHYVINVIYRYISLYILYNYGLHPSLRSLFHLHVELYTPDFFIHSGEAALYDPLTRTFNESLISQRIRDAITPYLGRYKALEDFSPRLNYSDLEHFSQSFYLQIKNLDYTEV
jgi:hypothetical protein